MDRSLLLPKYLLDNSVWTDMSKAIDKVFKGKVDDPARYIQWIRDYFIQDEAMKQGVETSTRLLSLDSFNDYDRVLLIRLANLVGFSFRNSSDIADTDYLRILRNLPNYWYSPGNASFIDFFSLMLNSPFEIVNMWTEDYKTFVPEGSAQIGTKIYNGGTWYPTTHVEISYDAIKFPVSFNKVIEFFYYIDPYNLVLKAVKSKSTIFAQPFGIAMAGRLKTWYS